MNEATLPPSPNWYLGNILACAKDGTVAWGARNAIVVATADRDKKIQKYSIINDAHIDRVTSLAFSPKFGEKDDRLLVSCGDENVIRIWNLDSMNTVMAHSYTDTQQKVAGVDWSKANSNIVCCVATDGSLVVWNLNHNVAQQMSLGKLTATCLSCCPHDPELVAVGTKSGLVYVVNVHGAGKVVYKLRGHDAEISSLSWCPIETNLSTGSEARDLLLASGGKDRSIFIWKAGGDGRYQIELTLPSSPLDSRQHKSKLGPATGGWTAVCWAAPKVLLTSSSWGELLSWDLAAGSKGRTACKLIHACHSRGLFCIASVQEDTDSIDENWRSKDTRSIVVWTLAQDRRVVRSEVKALDSEITYNVMTQGGYVYCIAASPLDTSRVAFGVGDAMLRLWNLCEPHENTFDITMLWQKIKGKVMSISWHPEKENFLAFGTGEGRVGVFDTNVNKPPILYRQYHRHAVYTLGWGPQPNGRSGHVLYSCGDGELVYYDPEKPTQEPKSVIRKDCTEFSWKPDGSCLIVGFENGAISILNRDLEECGSTIHSLKKAVQCFAWHPESTSTDPNLSPLRHQLAVSTNAQTIALFDLTDVVGGYTSTGDTTTATGKLPSHKIIGSLSGHTAKVVDLAWSPHISGYLASASYDNTVQVWKTESQELLGTYTSHCGPVYCCMWSPLDPDFILTGSADFTVRIWRLSEQAVRLPVENSTKPKKVRTKKNKHKVEKIAVAQANAANDREEENPDGLEDILSNAAKITNVEYATSERDIRAFLAMDQIKRKKNKKLTYFPVMAKSVSDKETVLDSIMNSLTNSHQMSDRESDCTLVIERTDDASAEGTPDKGSVGLSIFGSREQVLQLLETEKSAHAKLSQHDTVVEMDLWCNNLKQNLQEAAKAKRLNDFLVSLAPSLSFKVWQETCETYAAQLEFEGNHRKAVSYLLCIHKIDRAIQVFVEAKMFREAYVLAKCKLDPTDPLVDNLLAAWAIGAAREGNFEDAVQCCIKLGNYKEAAEYLSKRKDSRSLDVAARLALKSGDEEYSATLAEQAVTEALLKADYDSADNIIQAFPQIQYYKVITGALREMDGILKSSDDGQIWEWLEGNAKESVLRNLLKRYPDCDRYYELLLKSCATLQGLADKSMLWIEAGKQIAVAAACTAGEKQLHHLVGVMGAVSRYETVCVQSSHSKSEMNEKQNNVLAKLLSHFREINPCSEHGVFVDKEPSIRKSLRAYICYGILNWLLESDVGQIEGSRKELVESLIENLIGDALDKQTVKYNLISAEVNKLEGSLAVAMGKSNDVGEIGGSAKENVENLMERLAEIRSDKNKFLTDRLHAPNPVLVYSKARELTSVLFEGETHEKLTNLLTFTWTEATS